jgi:hypothetical protein
MSYQWRYHDETGADVPGPTDEFPDKAAAESWFGGQWLELRRLGVKSVTLMDGDTAVGSPMELEEA